MPSPVVTHVILTSVLLGIMLSIAAIFSSLLLIRQLENINLALSEVTESVARETVELVSLFTLGGGGYSYMAMTLPGTLAGQPYEILLSEEPAGAGNVLKVTAKLQIYQQVRVVVTPNFGREPVHAVGTPGTSCADPVEIPGLGRISNRILLPLPSGRPVVAAYRYGGSICVGFAAARS